MSDLPHYISLGGGVQSSTMALMFSCGELSPMPAGAIFADTGDEPQSVYDWVDWIEPRLQFPLYRVGRAETLSSSALTRKVTKDGRIYSRTNVPVFTLSPTGQMGKVPHRSCTRDFKIRPITKKLRQLAQVKRGEKSLVVVSCLGISLDEVIRAKPSREPWVRHRFPLLEKRMTRQHCLEWMSARGFPQPPRSACWHCPFHSDAEWRRLQLDEPDEFAKAVEFERKLQAMKARSDNFGSTPFLNKRCQPLDTIDFRSDIEAGQMLLWQDECEGMCGV